MQSNDHAVPTNRIEIVDVLRGFALLGIIMVHFVEQYYAGAPPAIIGNFSAKNLVDEIVAGFVDLFVIGKFYMIFSFLFGLSFYLQLHKSDGSFSFALRFAWRLVILFAIGFIHHLHYRGDILTIYATLGLGLLLVYRLPDKWILTLAVVGILNLPSFVIRLVAGLQPQTEATLFQEPDQKALEAYYYTVKSGAYLDILKANFHEFNAKTDFQIESGRVYITFGLFLFGLYVGRKKFFEKWRDQLLYLKELRKKILWTLLTTFLTTAAFFGGLALLKIQLKDSIQWAVGGLAYDIFNACVSSFYVLTLLLLFSTEKWHPRLMNFYAVGRMGLTTYLMQTVLGTILFFSYGLGFLAELGASACLVIALIVYVFQIEFSKRWLAHFRYGWFEWLWRWLTYFRIPRLQNNSASG